MTDPERTNIAQFDPATLDWDKTGGLIPAIVQHAATRQVLMLGYMNREALDASLASGKATFFSRSKQRLWQKGESSGNSLTVVSIEADCDGDTLLVLADPAGPTCHRGTVSCFGAGDARFAFPASLESIVAERASADPATSYTASLIARGIKRIAQKVGEEGVETALAAATGDIHECISETADLAFHLTVMLKAIGRDWAAVEAELARRHVVDTKRADNKEDGAAGED